MSAVPRPVKVLVKRLHDEAYKQGLTDAQNGLPDKKYRDAADRANTARNKLLAAVTELIEADKEHDAAHSALAELNTRIAEKGKMHVDSDALLEASKRFVDARLRRAAALALCTGGSP